MITITIYGLDQFVVGTYSREVLGALASAYEVSPDEINFIAPESMVFHAGVEQTSWHGIVKVTAPKKVSVLEDIVTQVISKTIATYCINVEIIFEYYEAAHRHYVKNEKYPRYILDENIGERDVTLSNDMPDLDDHECECGDECSCHEHDHECHCHEEGHECRCHDDKEDDVYLGNAFEGLEDELAKRK